jgi:putative spermidine/putrescine transport system ATP-binding protein
VARLELRELSKQFGTVPALAGLTLELSSGEFVSLLGPSGCGKTTALRIVAGFEQPTGGRVIVDGRDLTGVPPNKRNMGMVFQAYSLFPNMTARHNVEFGLRVRGTDRARRRRRADELLELVGLAARAEQYPHQLSGGQQQRVALARALAIEPAVLLLDEPLSALDAKVRVALREEIRRIQTRLGITTLYVTHDQEEALSISDRVAVLSEGRLEQVGTPAQIYQAPSTPFVAEFVGTMNRLAGTIERQDTVLVEGQGGQQIRLPVGSPDGQPPGASVLVLIRPESVSIEQADSERAAAGSFGGRVIMHTFLGPVTRIGLDSDLGPLTADVPSREALTLAPGTAVMLRVDPAGVRLLPRGAAA